MTLAVSATDSSTDRICVLHVDDEPDLADLSRAYLTRADERLDVRTATGADEGMDVLAAHDVDCVVSDYDMPGRDGIEFLEAVREEYPDLPFILFTGKGSEEIASEAISAGVSDYLQKETGTDQYTILANRIRNYVERARAKREHDAIRERMEITLEKTRSVIFEIDLDTGVVTRHGYFEHFFDLQEDDVPTWEDHLERAVHPDDRDECRRFYRQLMDGERSSGTIEYRTAPGSGKVEWMRDTVHIDETEPRCVLGIAQDITAQKNQQREREQIVERVTDAIVEVDADWTFTLVNDQAEELYEMEESYLLGRDFWEVFAEARETRFEAEYRRVMETREPTSFVEYFSQLDGWFDIKAYPKSDGGIAFYFVDITDQRERRHELEQTNALLETLFETLPVGVLAEGTDRNVLAVNERTVELFGLPGTPDEVVGADCEQLAERVGDRFVDPEGFVERTDEIATTCEPTDGEELALDDGRTFERSHRALELPDGRGHLWVYHDVTERKDRERRLREEQQFVKSIFDALPDPIYAFDTDGYPRRWNDRLETVTGYTADEIADMHATEFVPEDETDAIATHFQQILDERRSVTVESAVETEHGTRIPFEFTGAPLVDSDGALRGVTGVGRDMTEHEEHEAQLRSLNERSQELMTADTRAEIAEIGVEAARDILGLEANSIHLYDEEQSGLVPAATTEAVHELVGDPPVFTGDESIAWRVYERGEALALDDIQTDPDVYNPETSIRSELFLPLGSHGLLLAGSPAPDTFDQEDLALGKILAGNIASALEQVRQTEQLRARTEELVRKNERLSEFSSVVSHDLRNPLSVAAGHLELAREECESDHLDAVGRAHDRMDALIDDLLTLSQVEEPVAETAPVSLATVVDECWTNVATGDASLVVAVDRTVDADESRLKQVFENLIRNSVEHGGREVTVTVGELDDGFYVEDDGPGIPADDREHVFDAGYSTNDAGTGFGLRIVEQVVEAHGWEIRVTDGPEGGARFEITGVEFGPA